MLKAPNDRRPMPALALVAALALSGAALATDEPVPASEAGPFSPEQLRGLLSGPVQVAERVSGKWRGSLLIRRFSEDGRWTGCVVDPKGKVYHQKIREWNVTADSRGRAKLFSVRPAEPRPSGPFVIHYDPDTGRLLWRRKPRRGDRWVDWNEGWFQAKWPKIAVDKCPDLDLGGLAVDARQTGVTLEELRKQTPDAPLKGLARPLPGLQGKACKHHQERAFAQPCPDGKGSDYPGLAGDGALPEAHRHAAFRLTDGLIAKGEPVRLSWVGEQYAGHRFLFHDKTLTIVAPGETYLTGQWRWTNGHLQVWVDGEEQHAGSIAWRELARELGVTPTLWTPSTPDRH